MSRIVFLAVALLALTFAGCGMAEPSRSASSGHNGSYKIGNPYQVAGHWYYPLASAAGYSETGIASWYGAEFHGRNTANGERYDMHAMSAAHKTLPMPTMVRVTNLDNGRSIVVRVNDRGPFVKNRIIDLSYAAAKALDYDRTGTAHVRVEALGYSTGAGRQKQRAEAPAATSASSGRSAAGSAGMYIQLGAFSSHSNALRLKALLQKDYPSINIYSRNGGYAEIYRVRIGPFDDARSIENNVLSLQRQGYSDAIVVTE